ncbi:MAG: DUF192 domain-containing protein [bacterium]
MELLNWQWIVLLAGLVGTAFLTWLTQRLAWRWQLLDYPGVRKIHSMPVALGGGMAPAAVFVIGTMAIWQWGPLSWYGDVQLKSLLGVMLAVVILMVGGYLDDAFDLKPWQQLIAPVLAVVAVIASDVTVKVLTNPSGGLFVLTTELSVAITFVWLLGISYTTKILDGVDGLVSSLTLVGSLVIFALSMTVRWYQPGMSLLSLLLVGCMLGFLIFNWHPAKIFLGEGGSVWCGFMLGFLAILSGAKLATALLVIALPVIDLCWTIFRRLFAGQNVAQADQGHLHYRLLDQGWGQRSVVIFYVGWALAFGLSSLLFTSWLKIISLALAAFAGLLLVFGLEKASRPRSWGWYVLTSTVVVLLLVTHFLSPVITRRDLSSFGQASMVIGNNQLTVFMADSSDEWAQGLAGQESLPYNIGMLFVFPEPGERQFWMKKMKFDLDLIWLNDNKVIGVTSNVDYHDQDRLYYPPGPADAVLEVPAGWVERTGWVEGNGIKIGDSYQILTLNP